VFGLPFDEFRYSLTPDRYTSADLMCANLFLSVSGSRRIPTLFVVHVRFNERILIAAVGYTEITHSSTAEMLQLQPRTLRDYVNTLEPYNPEVHGWRDTTPPVLRSIKHGERATQLVTAIRMSGLQDIEILGVSDGHS